MQLQIIENNKGKYILLRLILEIYLLINLFFLKFSRKYKNEQMTIAKEIIKNILLLSFFIRKKTNTKICPNKAKIFSSKVAFNSLFLNLEESDFLNFPILNKSIPTCPGIKLATVYASEFT